MQLLCHTGDEERRKDLEILSLVIRGLGQAPFPFSDLISLFGRQDKV